MFVQAPSVGCRSKISLQSTLALYIVILITISSVSQFYVTLQFILHYGLPFTYIHPTHSLEPHTFIHTLGHTHNQTCIYLFKN